MFKRGVIGEVKKFIRLKVGKEKSSFKVIGIREIKKYLDNQENLTTIKELIAIKTRQYAKRQMTWSRGHMLSWKKIDPSNLDTLLKNI